MYVCMYVCVRMYNITLNWGPCSSLLLTSLISLFTVSKTSPSHTALNLLLMNFHIISFVGGCGGFAALGLSL